MYFPLSSMCNGINVPGGKVQIIFPQSFEFFFFSVAKSCLTHCDSMDSSTPGSSVLHGLQEFAQNMSIDSVRLSNHLMYLGFMKPQEELQW